MRSPFRIRKSLLFSDPRVRAFSPAARLGNERGFALILALSMLVLLSILGVMSLSDSSTEIGIAGNYRTGERAFSAADRALEYSLVHGSSLVSGSGTIDLYTINGGAIRTGTNVTRNGLTSGMYQDSGENTLTYLASGAAPPGSGSDVTTNSSFKAFYYLIKVEGAYPVNGTNPSRCKLENQAARIVPN